MTARYRSGASAAMTAFVIAAASIAVPTAHGQQPIEVKISLSVANDPNHEFCKLFAAEIEARAGGKMVGRVFPAAQLGTDARALEGVQLGTIEVLSTVPAFAALVAPDLLLRNGGLVSADSYPRLLAALFAAFVAWRTRQ